MQKALLQSDVHSKSDKTPVTVADYGLFSNSTLHTLLSICEELLFFCDFHYARRELLGRPSFLSLFLALDPGSQAIVSFVLEKELSTEPFSLVAEEVNISTSSWFSAMFLSCFFLA